MSAVLDTHAIIWFLENSSELSSHSRSTIEDAIRGNRHVYISAISLIETIYLAERGRIPAAALQRLRESLADPRAGLLVAPVDASVANLIEKISRSVVADMPDRIIAATALHLGMPLITRDRQLQGIGIKTIW